MFRHLSVNVQDQSIFCEMGSSGQTAGRGVYLYEDTFQLRSMRQQKEYLIAEIFDSTPCKIILFPAIFLVRKLIRLPYSAVP